MGRSVSIHAKEAVLQRHKAAQADPAWQEAYRSTRRKVEGKIAHCVRVAWGGRKARTPNSGTELGILVDATPKLVVA